ncbi:hypothetical protein GRI62_13005 [Erythrobacter arachoides]|uniref:Uncharacterized protein n=1 Tax=Aurantiacibacter arachoides TaxID=1850444 RepID=A0A845A5T8_9SPHN|nr:AIM24 family protein [Aurantiacibacter arachoides]MXO94516.1 hypothetical protein [Aurantiacibacter arachoides]GGD62851.1 hypothetical protein GCM10011411_23900 [Aurantiacibacter arachoides]
MKAAFAWLGRTGLTYLLLFAGLAFFVFVWPSVRDGFTAETLRQDTMSLEAVRGELASDYASARSALGRSAETYREESGEALSARLTTARAERAAAVAELEQGGGWLDAVRPSRILATKRLELRIGALDAEIALLTEATSLADARARQARHARMPTERSIAEAARYCTLWTARLASFEARTPLAREIEAYLRGERQRLEAAKARECDKQRDWELQRRTALEATRALATAQDSFDTARSQAIGALPDPANEIDGRTLRDIAWMALLALLAILLTPLAIRTLFYYGLAPLVERGPPIRLATPSGMRAVPSAPAPSRPTLAVTLADGQELLVRQSYLQSSPSGAEMRTQWLLSWRNVLTSLASGMAFLTRASGPDKTFGISARDDPFAEIARIDMPAASAMVMQPRALAAIVQPVDRPLQIRSRWRLFSLHAWLTFQFRYLVFYGPGTLIVKGGRGVRVERAEDGRRFGQDQLIGFSADTAYSVARNETFAPYLMGREPLFRDRVATDAGDTEGILVIEEAPLAGRRKGLRGGLEGAFDAALKAFGI